MDLLPSRSRRRRVAAVLTVAGVSLSAAALAAGGGGVASASSHREAPFIAGDPQHDNTDVYAFTSPDKPETVTLIANWIPFEEPNGGPNFYPWAAGSHYNINIDNNGDGKADVTYRWVFHNRDARGTQGSGDTQGTFLYNNGTVTSLGDSNLLFKQVYDLFEIRGNKTTRLLHSSSAVPSDVGPVSMPSYNALRNQGVATSTANPGLKSIATQAADPFFLDLRVFDLLYGAKDTNGDGKNEPTETGQNTLAGYNVNTIALQVPKTDVALRGNPSRNPVVGVWSTTDKQTVNLESGKSTGPFVQVSRLGNPLVNEVVIPAQLKDTFNSISPDVDHTVKQAVARVLDPELAHDIQAFYGIPAPKTPRTDLAEIFLSGICKSCFGGPIAADLNSQKLNKDGFRGYTFVPAEELRLNLTTPVTTSNPNRLGVLGRDNQGFPNGRRLGDDVVDIEVRAVEGAAIGADNSFAKGFSDGVSTPQKAFGDTFPYVALPNHDSVNQNVTGQADSH